MTFFCRCIDSATRRRAACDFLQALRIFFEPQVIAIYSQYIDAMQKVCYQLYLEIRYEEFYHSVKF